MTQSKWLFKVATLTLLCLHLQACTPLIIGAVGVGAAVSIDRRPAILQSNDKGLQIQLSAEIKRNYPGTDVDVTVWNRRVLLTGTVFNQEIKNAITQRYSTHPNITQLFNEIQLGFSPGITTATTDTAITTRIRSLLTTTAGINSGSVKVTTYNNRVYLMGWLKSEEIPIAINIARSGAGVIEVINLIETVS